MSCSGMDRTVGILNGRSVLLSVNYGAPSALFERTVGDWESIGAPWCLSSTVAGPHRAC